MHFQYSVQCSQFQKRCQNREDLFDILHSLLYDLELSNQQESLSQFITIQLVPLQQSGQQHKQTSIEELYQMDILHEQVLLFDADSQILDYIATEVTLAQKPIEQLTAMCYHLIRLCREQEHKHRPIQLLQFGHGYTKDQLNRLEEKCLQTFLLIKEERKRIETCCVCLHSISTVVLLDCMHMVLCADCASKVEACPICKEPIAQRKTVYY